MAGFLRQATASQVRAIGPFVDDTDFKTLKTGLTIANTDIKLVVNGGASANKNSGGGTHRVNGVYGLTFDATDTATVGEIEVSVLVSGALVVFDKFVVIEEAVYDALFAASAAGALDAAGVRAAVGLASANLDTQLTAIDDFIDTEVATIVTALTGNRAEPGQGAPAASTTILAKIDYLYKAWRNKHTQTATTYSLMADDTTTVDQKATVSDDATTFSRGEIATGP